MKTTTSGRAFAKNAEEPSRGYPEQLHIFDLFSTLMISLPIETHKIFIKSYPNSFTAEDAIANLGGLQFIQAHHDADPKDPTRIITRIVTTQFSLSRDMAKNLCQTFMDARLFECATDPSKRDFQNKGIYQVTGKGAHIVEKFVHRNSLSVDETRHITANATPRILFLERAEDEDAIILTQAAVDAIFKRFAGLRPNIIARPSDVPGEASPLTSSPGRDRIQANLDRCNGIEVKDQQHNYDVYKNTFYGKAAVEWLLDFTTVISKEEAIRIAQEMVAARYIEQVGDDGRGGPSLFKTANSSLYHFTEIGRAVLGWESLMRSRGSSVNTDWMDGKHYTMFLQHATERGQSGSGVRSERVSSDLLLSAQFKLTSNTIPRLPISVSREKRRSADETSLGGTTQYSDDSGNTVGASRRLSQILSDPAFQILTESSGMSSYAPSSSGRESVGQREGGAGNGSSVTNMGSSTQSMTSNTTRLNLILSNTTLRDMFKNFLKQNICEENLAFYLEVLDYKNKFNALINSTRAYAQSLTQDSAAAGSSNGAGAAGITPTTLRELEKQICTQAFSIHETFLVSGAPKELNLPHQMRHDITAYMQAVVRNMETPPTSASPTNDSGPGAGTATPSTPTSPSSTNNQGENGERRESVGLQKELIHISLFDRIHEHIFRLMSADSVPKFTKTDKYREVMMNRVRQRDNSMNSNGGNNGLVSNIPSGLRSPPLRNERLERSTTPGADAIALALSVVEIKENIARYLHQVDLARLAKVSTEWRAVAHQLLYRDIKISTAGKTQPSPKLLQVNSQFIRTLEFNSTYAKILPIEYWFLRDCTRLKELSLIQQNHRKPLIYLNPDSQPLSLPVPPDLEDVIASDNFRVKNNDDDDDDDDDLDDLDFILFDTPPSTTPSPPPAPTIGIIPFWDLTSKFVMSHKNTLQHISIANAPPLAVFWKVLAQELTSTLESLTIKCGIHVGSESDFWITCSNLISLDAKFYLVGPAISRIPPPFMPKNWDEPPLGPREGPPFFPRLKNLDFSFNQTEFLYQDLALLKNCPSLETLAWKSHPANAGAEPYLSKLAKMPSPYVYDTLESSHPSYLQKNLLIQGDQQATAVSTNRMTTRMWPNLHSITLYPIGIKSNDVRGEGIAELLLSMETPCTQLDVNNSGFGDLSLSAIVNSMHAMSIKTISIRNCPYVTSSMIQMLLVSCQGLEEIDADKLYVIDMMHGENQLWRCMNLRVLSVVLDLADPNDLMKHRWENEEDRIAFEKQYEIQKPQIAERQKTIMMQLSRMKKLTFICASLCTIHHNRSAHVGVEFTLDAGLDQLKGLTKMEELYFGGWYDTPHVAEAEWMLKYWEHLKIVHRGRYVVDFNKWGHDLEVMFAADQSYWSDQTEFMVYS
ncbi:hypothetical protein BGZ76_011682 [Entomortierella beljakovae]|nr:hypothetical protein BGZ76_011682 [Entomortierella beljakovae]